MRIWLDFVMWLAVGGVMIGGLTCGSEFNFWAYCTLCSSSHL